MRIVIDLQGAQTESRYRGIGRYSLSMAKAIVRNRGNHEVIIALSGLFPDLIESIRAEFDALLPQENIRVWYAPGPVRECHAGNQVRRETAEFIREAFLASLQADIVYISSLFEGYADDAVTSIGQFDHSTPVIVSLYDLIPLQNPEHYLQPNSVYEQYYQRKIQYLKKSTSLFAISRYSQQEGVEVLDFPLESVVNVSTAVDENFKPLQLTKSETLAICKKFGINRSIILYTGGADERKNLPRLINAYAQLSTNLRDVHQLVFAGKITEDNIHQLQKQARCAGLSSDELLFTGYIADDELVKLYNLCKLYVFPSWHEGFGLPALEAMSCGAPVIGANTSSLPEVIGNHDSLFDPFSEKSIAEKITQALSDELFRKYLIEQGLNQAKIFSWDKSAVIAINAFEYLVKESKKKHNRLVATHILTNQIAKVVQTDISDLELVDLAQSIALNHTQAGFKQLFVDVSELSQRDAATGVQRVTRSILIDLLNYPPKGYKVEPVYATVQSDGYYYAREFTAKLLGRSVSIASDELVEPIAGDCFLGLDLQHHVVIAQAKYYEYLKKKNVSVYFVVYDLLPITFFKHFAKDHSEIHAQWLDAISRFGNLICISETVKSEVQAWLEKHFPKRLANIKIDFFHLGADIQGTSSSLGREEDGRHILKSLQGNLNFLMVGTLEPRKGQKQVLLAFEELWSRGVQLNLLLVGRQGWMVDELIEKIQNHPRLNKELYWFNGIGDKYLDNIYQISTCLIAAAEGEGFGLPLIEAAQHQLPIIARDIPIFREVASQYAYFFKDDTASELALSLESWIELYQKNEHLKSSEISWITWHQSASRLLKLTLGSQEQRPEKQVFLDISELVQKDARSGIQRVVRSLLKELLSLSFKGVKIEPVYATLEEGYRYARSFTALFMGQSLNKNIKDELIEYRNGDVFLGLDLQPQVQIAQQEFYKSLRIHGVRVLFVVHDLLAIRKPEWFPIGSAESYEQWLKVITQQDGAICVSKATADDLTSWQNEARDLKLRSFNIYISHNGADIKSSIASHGIPRNAENLLKVLNEQPSFLMVGTIEPRKGVSQVLAAFDKLWSDDIKVNLVIVGKKGWMVEELTQKISQHSEFGKNLFWLEGVSDEYLEKIYTAATCLIAASEGEGFGLPLIEAAQHNLSIIARDIPVFREIAGDNAYYFSGLLADNLFLTIKRWLELYSKNEIPKSNNIQWLTWKESCKVLTNYIFCSN